MLEVLKRVCTFGTEQIYDQIIIWKVSIDHIAISDGFISNMETKIGEWNLDKKLSDHKGFYVELKNKCKMSESESTEIENLQNKKTLKVNAPTK